MRRLPDSGTPGTGQLGQRLANVGRLGCVLNIEDNIDILFGWFQFRLLCLVSELTLARIKFQLPKCCSARFAAHHCSGWSSGHIVASSILP